MAAEAATHYSSLHSTLPPLDGSKIIHNGPHEAVHFGAVLFYESENKRHGGKLDSFLFACTVLS